MLKIRGTQQELNEFMCKYDIYYLTNVQVEVIEFDYITDEEIDKFGKFTDDQKDIIKEMYSTHEKGFFKNPTCAL